MENLISTNMSVSQLIQNFEVGDIAVPEIQRDVVWKPEQIKQLIDSINQGFPCGSLILWEPREKDHSLVRSIMRPERLDTQNGRLPRYFLLDGQQRVTALASVILRKEKLKELLAEIEEEIAFIFINLKRFPREMEATTDIASYKFPWVLYNSLFDGSIQNDSYFRALSSKDHDQITRYVQKVRDYQFPVQIIRDRDYATVGEIFTRVNSQGTQLTGAEIHLARIVPHWRGITREFRNYRRHLRQQHYDLDLTFLMRAITVIECGVPRIKKLAERVAKDKLSRSHLNKTWARAKGATDKLINVLQRTLLLDKSKFFTSKNALIPLVYYLSLNRSASKDLQRFFVFSQLSEHYGSSGESTLAKDFRTLTGHSKSVRLGLTELVGEVNKEARQYYRGLRIKPDEVRGLPSKNVLMLLMYILMRKRGASDWGGGDVKIFDDIAPEEMQIHHIFPFNFMVNSEVAFKAYEEHGLTIANFRDDVNDIANLTFLTQATNAGISDNPPIEYLPNETTKASRKAHFIPEHSDLWRPENYMKFLAERRKMLAQNMNRFLSAL